MIIEKASILPIPQNIKRLETEFYSGKKTWVSVEWLDKDAMQKLE